jgi:hypothetical protein
LTTPADEHHVDEGRDQRQQHLEDENVGQREEAHGLVADEGGAMLPDGLQVPKDQRKRWRMRPLASMGASVKASARSS